SPARAEAVSAQMSNRYPKWRKPGTGLARVSNRVLDRRGVSRQPGRGSTHCECAQQPQRQFHPGSVFPNREQAERRLVSLLLPRENHIRARHQRADHPCPVHTSSPWLPAKRKQLAFRSSYLLKDQRAFRLVPSVPTKILGNEKLIRPSIPHGSPASLTQTAV